MNNEKKEESFKKSFEDFMDRTLGYCCLKAPILTTIIGVPLAIATWGVCVAVLLPCGAVVIAVNLSYLLCLGLVGLCKELKMIGCDIYKGAKKSIANNCKYLMKKIMPHRYKLIK
jgi:hypothetical protein